MRVRREGSCTLNPPADRNVHPGSVTFCYLSAHPCTTQHTSKRWSGKQNNCVGFYFRVKRKYIPIFSIVFIFWKCGLKEEGETGGLDRSKVTPNVLPGPQASLWSTGIWAVTAPHSDNDSGLFVHRGSLRHSLLQIASELSPTATNWLYLSYWGFPPEDQSKQKEQESMAYPLKRKDDTKSHSAVLNPLPSSTNLSFLPKKTRERDK